MLNGIAKKGAIGITGVISALLVGSICILLGIDPEQALAEIISEIMGVSLPRWMGIPVIQAFIFAFGIACFVVIDWLDKKAYREFFVKSPPRDMPIHEAVDYIVNDSNIQIPENFSDRQHDYVRMQIRDQALSGNCIIWGRKEIKFKPYSAKEFDEAHHIVSIDELKDIVFNENVFIPACDPYCQTDYVDAYFDRQGQYYLFTDLWVSKKNIQSLWPRKSWIRRIADTRKNRIAPPVEQPSDSDLEQEAFNQILGEMQYERGKS